MPRRKITASKLELTSEELDLWLFDAFARWDLPCAVAAWVFSILEPISSA